MVVTDRFPDQDDPLTPTDAEHLVVQRSPGLNGAVRDGAEHARRLWPADGVAALVGDLPALRPGDLAQTLRMAAQTPTGYVPDASGLGTTLITAQPGSRLNPQFGARSATRHIEHATVLDAGASLRCDVDTTEDLATAALLGLRQHTASIWAQLQPSCLPGVHDGVA